MLDDTDKISTRIEELRVKILNTPMDYDRDQFFHDAYDLATLVAN